jgi:hypothetical protein
MKLHCDLHLHTALSPCGEERMTPNNIVNMALVAGLDLIAITDHNTCGNCRAAMEVGARNGLAVIPGMELTSSEEAHILCLFPTADDAERFEREIVRPNRIAIANRPEVFGRQLYLDAEDRITGEEENLLIPATGISAGDVQQLCRTYHGVAIPAHIDKDSFSLLASLGWIDPEMDFPVCEITPRCDAAALVRTHPELAGVTLIHNSDAHDLGPIGISPDTIELPQANAETAVRYFAQKTNGGVG